MVGVNLRRRASTMRRMRRTACVRTASTPTSKQRQIGVKGKGVKSGALALDMGYLYIDKNFKNSKRMFKVFKKAQGVQGTVSIVLWPRCGAL
jgi:hypothetical protein